MGGKTYGYARVSTKNQNEDRQVIALRDYGVEPRNIIVEKQSGKDFDRPLYRKMLRRLTAGDTLVVQSLDRLGRDYVEIQEQWRLLSKERGVSIVVLDMPLLCTQENQELINRLITDLVLQLFSFVAQTEREKIRERQRQGIEAAKARGVRFGRPRAELPGNFPEIVAAWSRGECTAREAARTLGVSRSTFFRRLREMRTENREKCGPQTVCEDNAAHPDTAARRRRQFRNTGSDACRHSQPSKTERAESRSDSAKGDGKKKVGLSLLKVYTIIGKFRVKRRYRETPQTGQDSPEQTVSTGRRQIE